MNFIHLSVLGLHIDGPTLHENLEIATAIVTEQRVNLLCYRIVIHSKLCVSKKQNEHKTARCIWLLDAGIRAFAFFFYRDKTKFFRALKIDHDCKLKRNRNLSAQNHQLKHLLHFLFGRNWQYFVVQYSSKNYDYTLVQLAHFRLFHASITNGFGCEKKKYFKVLSSWKVHQIILLENHNQQQQKRLTAKE